MAATRNSPSLTRRRLGALLRKYREDGEKKILSKAAAKHIGVESTVLGRMERGEHRIHPNQLEGLLELYGINDSEIHSELRRACMEPFDEGWWYPYRNSIPKELIDFAALENSAVSIKSMHPVGMDGLLQSASYIRDIQSKALTSTARDAEDNLVAFRSARQQVLTRNVAPVLCQSLLGEPTFHDTSPVIADQIRHLLSMSFRPNVKIHIMPMKSTYFRQMYTQAIIMNFRKPWPSVISTISLDTIQYSTDRDALERSEELFAAILGHSMSVEDTRSYLANRLDEIEKSVGRSAFDGIER